MTAHTPHVQKLHINTQKLRPRLLGPRFFSHNHCAPSPAFQHAHRDDPVSRTLPTYCCNLSSVRGVRRQVGPALACLAVPARLRTWRFAPPSLTTPIAVSSTYSSAPIGTRIHATAVEVRDFFFSGAPQHLLNPFRAPEPLLILNPSNAVPKTGFQLQRG